MATTKVKTAVDMKLEIVVIGVSDVDRAKRFYENLGWRLDADFAHGDNWRVIQLRPLAPGAQLSSARTSPRRHPAQPRVCT
jgi:catechol 2,3-dioxygenase-like lactoylglutathione lyase family enzyme